MASESLKSDPLRPPPPAPSEFYGVTVYDHVGDIVTIEPQMLAGRDIGECEEKAIYAAIESLRGFVGAKRNDLTALQASLRPAGQGELLALVRAIYQSTREDEKGEQWTIRAFLDQRGIFNEDMQGSRRLVSEACRVVLAPLPVPPAVEGAQP